MSKIEDFLTAEQERLVVEAIQHAERNTSGEIRVHLEKSTEKPPLERAKEVFRFLKMDQTKLQNGILFYVAVESKQFAIYGDKGIHEQVSDNFWKDEKDLVIHHFSRKENMKGLILAIEKVGEKLHEIFPIAEDDSNELSNEISKG